MQCSSAAAYRRFHPVEGSRCIFEGFRSPAAGFEGGVGFILVISTSPTSVQNWRKVFMVYIVDGSQAPFSC